MTDLPWRLVVPLAALSSDFAEAARRAAALGFGHVEVVARADRPVADLEALADTGAVVLTAALVGGRLDTADVGARRAALRALFEQVGDAARLGATCAYLDAAVEPSPAALACFAEACGLLAERAAGMQVRLALRPAVGALSSFAGLLAWLEEVDLPQVGAVLEEAGAAEVRRAAERLAYLRLGADSGVGELAAALREVGYRGCVALVP
jgi:sugar phosphate isomerase/epimerase